LGWEKKTTAGIGWTAGGKSGAGIGCDSGAGSGRGVGSGSGAGGCAPSFAAVTTRASRVRRVGGRMAVTPEGVIHGGRVEVYPLSAAPRQQAVIVAPNFPKPVTVTTGKVRRLETRRRR
jgi:hypothetical protein